MVIHFLNYGNYASQRKEKLLFISNESILSRSFKHKVAMNIKKCGFQIYVIFLQQSWVFPQLTGIKIMAHCQNPKHRSPSRCNLILILVLNPHPCRRGTCLTSQVPCLIPIPFLKLARFCYTR